MYNFLILSLILPFTAAWYGTTLIYSDDGSLSLYDPNDGQTILSSGISSGGFGAKFVQFTVTTSTGSSSYSTDYMYFVSSVGVYIVQYQLNMTGRPVQPDTDYSQYWNYHGIVAYGNGFLVCGGASISNNAISPNSRCIVYNGEYQYNVSQYQYHSFIPYAVYDGALFTVSGRYYYVGGRLSNGTVTNKTLLLDDSSATWSEIAQLPVENGLASFAYFSVLGTVNPIYTKFVVCGGIDGNDVLQSACYTFNGATSQWTKSPEYELDQARAAFPIVQSPNALYAIAGRVSEDLYGLTSSTLFLNSTNKDGNSWSQAAPLLNSYQCLAAIYLPEES